MAQDQSETNLPSGSRSFSWFLAQLQDGELHAKLTAELPRIGAALKEYVENYKGSPKAKLTLTLDFKHDKGVVDITGKFETKLPKSPAGGAVMWVGEDGNFTQDHPRQMNMFSRGPRPVAEA
jgi:hypothetical protein